MHWLVCKSLAWDLEAQQADYLLARDLDSRSGHTIQCRNRRPVVSHVGLRLTFIGLLLGKRSLDSNAWFVILCRGRVTKWDTLIGSEPR